MLSEERGILRDLGLAVGAWRRVPALPAAYLCLGVGAAASRTSLLAPAAAVIVGIVVIVGQLGLAGGSRVLYARHFGARAVRASDLPGLSLRFVGRFVGLGLTLLVIAVPAGFVAGAVRLAT